VGRFTLIGPDGVARPSAVPGTLGGHRRNKVYGRLDCAGALRWIAQGHYVSQRVFFADEATAAAAGYRPCARCLPERYAAWKAGALRVRIAPAQPWDGARVRDFLVSRETPGVDALAFGDGFVEVPAALARAARRVVDADADPGVIAAVLDDDPLLGPLVRARPGIRSPGVFDPYHAGVRAIVGQGISVTATRTIVGRLPDRERLARMRPEDLPMPRLRAEALIAYAGGAPLEDIRGVGPWTRGYVALRTGDPDVLLAGDLIVRRAVAALGGPSGAKDIARLGERWCPVRSYATHHLWAAYPALKLTSAASTTSASMLRSIIASEASASSS
jgi:AraC family transcriptional regulator of adaptative response / DNA-3-methyladenine glycosylase II